jgi:hypothetical protein
MTSTVGNGPGVKDGSRRITRRDVIKAGAIASGAVWVAPVVDSFVSRAAAKSKKRTGQADFMCSWAYLVWKYTGTDTVYYTGYQGDSPSTCGSDAANPHAGKHNSPSIMCTDGAGSANTYKLEFGGAPPPVKYSGMDIGSGTLTATSNTSTICSQFTYSGAGSTSEIHAPSDVEILAVFAFGAGSTTATCPTTKGGGNSIDVLCGGQ